MDKTYKNTNLTRVFYLLLRIKISNIKMKEDMNKNSIRMFLSKSYSTNLVKNFRKGFEQKRSILSNQYALSKKIKV